MNHNPLMGRGGFSHVFALQLKSERICLFQYISQRKLLTDEGEAHVLFTVMGFSSIYLRHGAHGAPGTVGGLEAVCERSVNTCLLVISRRCTVRTLPVTMSEVCRRPVFPGGLSLCPVGTCLPAVCRLSAVCLHLVGTLPVEVCEWSAGGSLPAACQCSAGKCPPVICPPSAVSCALSALCE